MTSGLAVVGRFMATLIVASGVAAPVAASAQSLEKLTIRGREQVLHLYGTRGGTPVVITSGDGGWIHLAPEVAELLAARGYFVVGFDARAYLESFTNGTRALSVEEEPGDYNALIRFAARGTTGKTLLIGVSEGAGLSVLAAAGSVNRGSVAGVIGLGLCDLTELGWRWRDMVIYVTHGTPKEPTFSVADIVHRLAPIPLAAIHSTHDEFVPLAEVRHVLDCAQEPKRLWIVSAANHRFSDNAAEFSRSLFEAIGWINAAGGAR